MSRKTPAYYLAFFSLVSLAVAMLVAVLTLGGPLAQLGAFGALLAYVFTRWVRQTHSVSEGFRDLPGVELDTPLWVNGSANVVHVDGQKLVVLVQGGVGGAHGTAIGTVPSDFWLPRGDASFDPTTAGGGADATCSYLDATTRAALERFEQIRSYDGSIEVVGLLQSPEEHTERLRELAALVNHLNAMPGERHARWRGLFADEPDAGVRAAMLGPLANHAPDLWPEYAGKALVSGGVEADAARALFAEHGQREPLNWLARRIERSLVEGDVETALSLGESLRGAAPGPEVDVGLVTLLRSTHDPARLLGAELCATQATVAIQPHIARFVDHAAPVGMYARQALVRHRRASSRPLAAPTVQTVISALQASPPHEEALALARLLVHAPAHLDIDEGIRALLSYPYFEVELIGAQLASDRATPALRGALIELAPRDDSVGHCARAGLSRLDEAHPEPLAGTFSIASAEGGELSLPRGARRGRDGETEP